MTGPAPLPVTVVGLGADGWAGVPERHRTLVTAAEVLLGGDRHLGMVPDVADQHRERWPSPLREGLPALLERHAGRRVVALASGDPLVSGIGTTLLDVLGADRVVIEPSVSSAALARARMGWPEETVTVVSAVARDPRNLLRLLAPGVRVLVLSEGAHTPAQVAALLVGAGYGASTLTVLSDLGGPTESRREATAADLLADTAALPALHVLAIALEGPLRAGWASGLPDDLYEHDGQLTKRDLRAAALARLLPAPGRLLWDVGAGAGSIGIEWMRAHPTCRAIAVEADEARAQRVGRNAGRLGVPGLEVVHGGAPEALAALPAPDAVFVGGGATRAGVVDACLAALRPDGRLVVHGVTLETEVLLAGLHRAHGGELTRIAVEHAAPVGTFTGWTPARTVTQWAWRRPVAG